MRFKKGQTGNPNGRPPVINPEIQKTADENKALFKQLVLQYFNLSEDQIAQRQRTPGIPFIEKLLGQCFEKTANDGNVDAFRKLLELTFGRIPDEPKEFELSPDEKKLVLTYRERRANALEVSRRPDSGDTEEGEH